MAYLITHTGKFADLKITPNATELPTLVGDERAFFAADEDDLYKAVPSGPDLAALYNAVGGESPALKVKRFKDRVDGARRTFGLIHQLHHQKPVEAAAPSPTAPTESAAEESDMKKAKKAKAAKAPKAKKSGSKALVRAESTRGKLLKLAVENSGEISLKAIATRAGVSGEGSMTAEARARMRLRVVAATVGATFEVVDGKVSFKLPAGTTLAKALGE